MIVSDDDAISRLSSPLNLMNRLKSPSSNGRRDAMGLFGINNKDKEVRTSFNPFKREDPPEESTALVPAGKPEDNPPETPAEKPPSLDSLIDNADSQIKLASAHDEALGVLVDSVKMIKLKLDDIKPEKLPAVIAATSKVVDQIQRQRIDANKGQAGKSVHFHFYTPTQRKVEEYDVVEVG